jgi:hypothetical protein
MPHAVAGKRRFDVLTIAAPGLLAFVLCLIQSGDRSLWLDEGATIAIVSQHGSALWRAIAHDGGNMFAYYLLIHVLQAAFGHSLVLLRLPSAIADGATAAIASAIGLRLFSNRSIALSAGLLTAVSLPLIFWGQDIRGYALMATFGAAGWLALICLVDGEGEDVRRGPLVAYVVCVLASLYVGFDAGLLIPAQLLLVAALPAWRRRLKLVIGALVLVALLSIPLAVLALERGSGQLFWVPPVSGSLLHQTSQVLTSAALVPNFVTRSTAVFLELLTWLALLFGLVVLCLKRQTERSALVPFAWIVVPGALALIVALDGQPIELARSAILLIPAVALALAWVAHRPGVPRYASLAAIAVVLALRAAALEPTYGVSPENWKAATDYVVEHGPACIVFYPQDGREPFQYYIRGRSMTGFTPTLPTEGWNVVKPHVEQYQAGNPGLWHGITGRCARLYFIYSHNGQPNGPPQSRVNFRRFIALQKMLSDDYHGHSSTHGFGYAAVVSVQLFTAR